MINDNLVINFHEHYYPNLIEDNEKMNIDISVLLPVGVEAALLSCQAAQKHPDKLVSFHWIDINNPVKEEMMKLERAVEFGGIKGLKFQPMDQHIYGNDKYLYPIYEMCEKLGLIVTWHSGVVCLGHKYELGLPMLTKYCNPIYLDEVAYAFPDLKICIAHLGGNYLYEALVLAEKHENIYVDTAFLGFFSKRFFPTTSPADLITHAVNVAGANKVLYGSEEVKPEDVMKAKITEHNKEKILGLNAARLLNISPNCKKGGG